MTKSQTEFLRDFLPERVEASHPLTLDALRAIPDAQRDYRPRPSARSARALAVHIIQTELMILDGIVRGGFKRESETGHQLAPLGGLELAEGYDRQFQAAVEQVRRLSVKQLVPYLSLYGVFRHPAVVFLTFLHDHTLHHCGQLRAYLREMGLAGDSVSLEQTAMKYVWDRQRRSSAPWPEWIATGDAEVDDD